MQEVQEEVVDLCSDSDSCSDWKTDSGSEDPDCETRSSCMKAAASTGLSDQYTSQGKAAPSPKTTILPKTAETQHRPGRGRENQEDDWRNAG